MPEADEAAADILSRLPVWATPAQRQLALSYIKEALAAGEDGLDVRMAALSLESALAARAALPPAKVEPFDPGGRPLKQRAFCRGGKGRHKDFSEEE